jgi:glycosyltransferase involved in cell wall biosynthesis
VTKQDDHAGMRSAVEPLSILLVNQYYAPADAPTAALLADVGAALAAEGNDVRAIASRRGYRDASVRYPRREQIDGVHVRRIGGTGFTQQRRWGRLINYFAFFASAGKQLLITRRADVVVCLSTPPLLAAIVQTITKLRGARFIYWVMDVHPELAFRLGHLEKTSITGRILEWSGRRTLERSDVVIALGNDMAKRIEPYSNGSTRVVPNWADGNRITPRPIENHPLRAEWGWDGKFVIAYSGNIGLVHEFDTIIEAAAKLEGDDRYLFCFIGGGPRENEVHTEVERRGLSNVEFRPWVPDDQFPDSLTAPDVHLVTLREDLAGLSVPSKTYSILAAGRPIAFVGPHDSDIAELMSSADCGIHVPNGDAVGLTDALRAYDQNRDLQTAHSNSARSTYEASFTPGRGLASIMALLRS